MWIIFHITLEFVFTNELGLYLIPHYSSIRDPWSYVIYAGRGYLVSHIASTNLEIDIASLFSY